MTNMIAYLPQTTPLFRENAPEWKDEWKDEWEDEQKNEQEDEIVALSRLYGSNGSNGSSRHGRLKRRRVALVADSTVAQYRFRNYSDRRAEVVFAIQNPSGSIWVHSKSSYPQGLYRLPTGGINWGESIDAALLREVCEETGLSVVIDQFLGVIDYCFHYEGCTANFASYVFLLTSQDGIPFPTGDEASASFREILPHQLLHLSADLRNLLGSRHCWGQWRAHAHDLAYESLVG